MSAKIIHFIQYHNAFSIMFAVVFLGFSISFAASPDMRDSIYSSTETVVSVDNGLIVSADLDNFNFNLRIRSVTEDEKNYYAVYAYQTLMIGDGFWQNKETEKTLTVSKDALAGKDLGLYLAEELGENINSELAYLKRVQVLEKERGESQKVVAVEYAGLIGKLLDPTESVIEGYTPVIQEPSPEVLATVESNPTEVVVSTPYAPPAPESATDTAEPPAEPVSESVSEPAPLPAPDAMVNEELVKEVVEELLQNSVTSDSTNLPQATSTPVSEPAAPAPEVISEPPLESSDEDLTGQAVIDATSTPEVIPEEPVIEATSTPEAVSEPASGNP